MSKPLINFHTYQKAWLKDKSRFKIGMFARQTGKTFTTCAEIVDDCIMAEIENRRARWVILSRGERQAKEAMDEAIKPFCKAFYIIYKDMLKGRSAPKFYKDTFLGADDISYKALEVEFPGGSRITALPANPDTARGFSANTFLDEFAFHQDSRAIWRALFPVISKPGLKLRVTSTPNGKKNKFYDLWTSLGNRWSKHEVDIHKAVELGLDRDIDELREGAGDDDLWRQEFLLKFLDDAGSWLAYDLIMAAEHGEAGRPDKYRGGLCYIGNDIGRRRDLWVAWVIEMVGDVRWTREVVILQNATFAEQDAALDELMGKYKVVRLAMDQTGMGEKPVEDAKRRYGSGRVEGVLFSSSRRLDIATASRKCFEDRLFRAPEGDNAQRADFHKPKRIFGPTGAPRIVVDDHTGDHADRFWAASLALAASMGGCEEYDYEPAYGHDYEYDEGRGLFLPGCY
ncbi:terminase [Deltaproteobacteria bacterium Smac51]|nr:terminase [Deltaproteobacteria bacterium Smac51]UQZ90519.1 terminase [Deltaproteobacteria bacterium Smac51]